MKAPERLASQLGEVGFFHYGVLCASGLGAVLLVLLQRGYGVWAVLPVATGILGGATRLGPVLLSLALAVCLYFPPHRHVRIGPQVTTLDIPTLILCASTLAYVAAHFRLQGMRVSAFPPEPAPSDPQVATDAPQEAQPHFRPAATVSRAEVAWLIVAVPALAILAQLAWRGLSLESRMPEEWRLGLSTPIWKIIFLAWPVAFVGWAAGLAFLARRRRSMQPAEARVLLQDILWNETRREQRRIYRWAAWAWLRRHAKESP